VSLDSSSARALLLLEVTIQLWLQFCCQSVFSSPAKTSH
jgi:hypothetical protein